MKTPQQLTNSQLPDRAPVLLANPASSSRTLKIEADGDFWKGLTKPKIRLMGRWLELAGFSPGSRVNVTCVAPGVIELRSANSPDVFNA